MLTSSKAKSSEALESQTTGFKHTHRRSPKQVRSLGLDDQGGALSLRTSRKWTPNHRNSHIFGRRPKPWRRPRGCRATAEEQKWSVIPRAALVLPHWRCRDSLQKARCRQRSRRRRSGCSNTEHNPPLPPNHAMQPLRHDFSMFGDNPHPSLRGLHSFRSPSPTWIILRSVRNGCCQANLLRPPDSPSPSCSYPCTSMQASANISGKPKGHGSCVPHHIVSI